MDHPENKEDDDHDHDHADDPDATAPVVHLNLLWTRWPESIGGSDRTWAVAHPWYALTSILRKRVPSLGASRRRRSRGRLGKETRDRRGHDSDRSGPFDAELCRQATDVGRRFWPDSLARLRRVRPARSGA